jgi:hypothetical protein
VAEPSSDSTRLAEVVGPSWDELVREGLAAGEGASLDVRRNKSDVERPKRGCQNGTARFMSDEGKVVTARCGRNSCAVCYGLKLRQWAEVVYLDALVQPPTFSLTLTTVDPVWNGEAYMRGWEQVLRALRRGYGAVEALQFMEQTTGKAPKSGGHRRGHGHSILKIDAPGQAAEIEELVWPIWERHTGAVQIKASELGSAGGAVAYLTLLLSIEKGKASQAPTDLPKGTRTVRPTRGYWSRPIAELRAEAKETLSRKAIEFHLRRRRGHVDELTMKELVEIEYQWQVDRRWYWLRPEPEGDELEGLERLEAIFEREIEIRDACKLVDVGEGQSNGGLAAERRSLACADSRPLVLGGEV